MQFPSPVKLGANCSRWPLSLLEKHEADAAGRDCEPRTAEDEIYLSDLQVATRYNVARNTVWRWAREPAEAVA